MKFFFTIITVIVINLSALSQEMLGIANSNYAGTHGINLNPSSMVVSKLYMDYSVFSANLSFDNTYFYLLRDDWYNLLFNQVVPVYYTYEGEERSFTIYRDDEYTSGYFGMRITGPAGMVVYGKHAFGLSTSIRSNSSFTNLPADIGNFLYEAIDFDLQHGIVYSHDKPVRGGTLNWMEVGLSYAYNFHRYRWNSWSFGVTVKPLFGMASLFTNIDNLEYEIYSDTTAGIYGVNFDYGYSLPVNYETNDFPEGPIVSGFGLGMDLGVTFMKTKKGHGNNVFGRLCEQVYDDYNYKIGISLLDIGYIKYAKKANYNGYKNTAAYWSEPDDNLPDSTLVLIDEKIDYYFLDNAEEAIKEDKYTMHLPPAFSVQIDYPVRKFLFLNATLIYGFNLGKSYIKRPSLLTFTPRYETNRMEISLPLSLYEWNWSAPRIGFAFRYGNFFFGIEKLNTALDFNDFTGMDVYIGLRLNLTNNFRMNFIKGNCDNKKLHDIEMFDYRNF